MSFDWIEYYNLAKELSGDESCKANEEAKNRSAISRAYYSAIIQARAKISKVRSIKPPFGNTHKWTIDEYRSYPDSRAKRIGAWLKRIKKAA